MKKTFLELIVVFLVVLSFGGFYTLNTNIEIGRERIAKMVIANHLNHLASVRISLGLANELFAVKRTAEIIRLRGQEARIAIDLLDDMKKYLAVSGEFPIEKFDQKLSSLREDFEKNNPYVAEEQLASLIKFVVDENMRQSY